jgi:hypothetical protein
LEQGALRFAGFAGGLARLGLGGLGHFAGLGFFTPDVRDGLDGRNIQKKTQTFSDSFMFLKSGLRKKKKLFFSF